MSIKIKSGDLEAILSEVQLELDKITTSAESLSKAHEGEETSPEVPPDTSATASSASPPADSSPPAGDVPPPPADPSAPPVGSPPPAPGDQPPPEGGGDGSLDPEALQQEFASMPIEHLQIVYQAVKNALMAKAPPADPSAPPVGSPPPADAPPPPMSTEKSESNSGGAITLVRSELGSLKTSLAKAEATIVGLAKVVDKLVSTPLRQKAVTGVSQIPVERSPAAAASRLSKAEVKTILDRKIPDQSLSKSDRELINRYDAGVIGVDRIAHLLT